MSGFRIIPSLLLKNKGLVKGINFNDYTYVGDPINTVRIFNDKEVDELFFFDITATQENRRIPFELVEKLANECYMPFAVGGGIKTIKEIKELIKLGVEKVTINTYAVENPVFIKQASQIFGSQAIVVSIDTKECDNGTYSVVTNSGKKYTDIDVLDHARTMEEMGAGELIINSIDRDGTKSGYDLKLVKIIADAVKIPVIASGGAGVFKHFSEVCYNANASAGTAGSFFVFHGKLSGVLISYPSKILINEEFS